MRRTVLAIAALTAASVVSCTPPGESARIHSCVEATKFGAFVGDLDATALWNAVGQDESALSATCTDMAKNEPDRLAQISADWDAGQRAIRAVNAAAPTTTFDSSCDPSYPAMCIPNGADDLDCSNVGANSFPVEPPDRHEFDTDHDGYGCVPGSDTG